jgi:hypothetical protein
MSVASRHEVLFRLARRSLTSWTDYGLLFFACLRLWSTTLALHISIVRLLYEKMALLNYTSPVLRTSFQLSKVKTRPERTYTKSHPIFVSSLPVAPSDQEDYKARAAATKPTIPPDKVSISLLRLREAAAPVDSAASSEVDEAPDSRGWSQH